MNRVKNKNNLTLGKGIIYSLNLMFLLLISCSSEEEGNRKKLIWAADIESGAPYVYQDYEHADSLKGFEAEIVYALAEKLDMKPVHFQNQWDNLLTGLTSRTDYDIVINGIEITPGNKKTVNFSIPYYTTFEQLVIRKGQKGIKSLDDLVGKDVGTLSASYAERLLKEYGGINVKSNESESNSFTDLKYGRLDAVLIDYPVAKYYALDDPELELIDSEIGEVVYGVAVRKSDTVLLNRINEALEELIAEGRIDEILKSNKLIEKGPGPELYVLTWERFLRTLPEFGKAAVMTMIITIGSMILAVFAGLFLALVKTYGNFIFSKAVTLFIELIRGTPLLIQLFIIHYGIPGLTGGYIEFPPVFSAIVGLGMNYAAYEAENYRAGLFSVPRMQMEAALALGMTRNQALRHIIIPQAVRLVIPPITNDFISLLKDSSLVAMVALFELTKAYYTIGELYRSFFIFGITVAAIYLLLGLPFVKLARWAEKKFATDKRRRMTP